jgi:hypothetical protein
MAEPNLTSVISERTAAPLVEAFDAEVLVSPHEPWRSVAVFGGSALRRRVLAVGDRPRFEDPMIELVRRRAVYEALDIVRAGLGVAGDFADLDPLWRPDNGWYDLTDEQRQAHMDAVEAGLIALGPCTCTTRCGEVSEGGCPACVWRDSYEPCPAIGFGCFPDCHPEDVCCTPLQRAARQRTSEAVA